jgi:hypothetical protein
MFCVVCLRIHEPADGQPFPSMINAAQTLYHGDALCITHFFDTVATERVPE